MTVTETPGRYDVGGTPSVSIQQLDSKLDLLIDQIGKLTPELSDFCTVMQYGFSFLKVITSRQAATAERLALTIERQSLAIERLALMLERVQAKEG
jgi:hypothetical protein